MVSRAGIAIAAAAITSVAGVAAAASAGASTGASAGATWRVVKQVHSGSLGDFTAVTAVGRSGGWAFDGIQAPTAWQRNGSNWTQVPFPKPSDDERVIDAAATSATDVWAFTAGDAKSRVLRWNGQHWSVLATFIRQIGGGVVISANDVWVFGEPFIPGALLGAWHYDGRSWSQVNTGGGLQGGSAVSANDIWAFDGSDVAHWNGRTWTRTSVGNLLPARQQLNGPAVTGIFAQSANSVYAIGNGNLQDEGGPTVVLHYDGHHWTKVAQANVGYGTQPLQQIASDGAGGLWLPMPGVGGQKSFLLHYANGSLTEVTLPVPASKINVDAIAHIPGTRDMLAGGYTHASANQGSNVVSVLLQYGT